MCAVSAVGHSSEQKTTSRQLTKRSIARSNSELGSLAEALVAQWLINQGWHILQRRWHCRWGELDIVARSPQNGAGSVLAFVEVKARSSGNWDQGGLLAITPQKQTKLWQTAELFLAENADLSELSCRFDVALVKGQRLTKPPSAPIHPNNVDPPLAQLELEQPIEWAGYRFTLTHYIESAFN